MHAHPRPTGGTIQRTRAHRVTRPLPAAAPRLSDSEAPASLLASANSGFAVCGMSRICQLKTRETKGTLYYHAEYNPAEPAGLQCLARLSCAQSSLNNGPT